MRSTFWLSLVLLIFTSACGGAPRGALRGASAAGVVFSHALHLTEVGLSCSDCHVLAGDGGLYSVPRHEVCMGCHEVRPEQGVQAPSLLGGLRHALGLRPADPSCQGCHTRDLGPWVEGERPPTSRYATARVDVPPVVFSHARHAQEGCERCHGDLRGAELARRDHLPTMAQCMSCHNGAQASAECGTCHPTLPRPWDDPRRQAQLRLPHPPGWERAHGPMAQGDESCALCHTRTGCQDCHSRVAPEDHRGVGFAHSSHGRLALLDRERCATCHVESTCQSCHTLPPATHTPTFMDPQQVEAGDRGADLHRTMARHDPAACLTCHTTTDCSTCHIGSRL